MSRFPSFHALAFVLLSGAVTVAGSQEHNTYTHELENSLVGYAVSDFLAHGPRPDEARNMDLRYQETVTGARHYVLCGQVRTGTGSEAAWVDFATIKTDPYEQWIGVLATAICAEAMPVPSSGRDLSGVLQRALNDHPLSSSTP